MNAFQCLAREDRLSGLVIDDRMRSTGQEWSADSQPRLVGQHGAAFTLVELLVLVAVLGVGALTLSPVLARTRLNTKAVICMNNMKQLTAGWTVYASDNNDRLAINSDGSQTSLAFPVSWAAGILDWSTSSVNTNTLYLTDDRVSCLAAYTARSPSMFWCPTDTYLSSSQKQRGWARRSRSVAMNAAVGDGIKYGGFSWSSSFWWAKKMCDLVAPGPSQSWVFIDEHPDSIDDTILYLNPGYSGGTGEFTELPACDHNGGCGVSFGDGRAEIHQWQERSTAKPVTYAYVSRVTVVNNGDLAWLARHTPRLP